MSLHYRAITHGPLSRYVESLWLSEHYTVPHAVERLMPTASMGIIIDMASYDVRATLHGLRSTSFALATAEQRDLIGVKFRPGGAYPFMAGPAEEYVDASVCLDDVWGPVVTQLRDQLAAARLPSIRFDIVEDALLRQLRRSDQPVVRFALMALASSPAPSVAQIAARTGYSTTRFITLFREQVGLSPKHFQRLERFGRVLRTLDGEKPDWTQVALAHGYFDQAHLIHDFGEFAGITPTAYLRDRVSTNHVRLTS